jgi:HEAT repeat protein
VPLGTHPRHRRQQSDRANINAPFPRELRATPLFSRLSTTLSTFILFLLLSGGAQAWPVPSIGKEAIPEDMPPRVKELVEQLYVDETCTDAANKLGEMGPDAVSAAPFLASILHGHYSLGTPNAAAKALVLLGPGAFDAVAAGATMPSADARRRGFHALTLIDPERAAPFAFALFTSEPPHRYNLAFLRRCGESARKLVLEALASEDAALRRRAVRALPAFTSLRASYRDMSGIETEIGVFNPDFHTQPVVDLLFKAAGDPDLAVRVAALESLTSLAPCADKTIPLSDALLAALRDKNAAVRSAAIDLTLVANTNAAAKIDALAPLVLDPDATTRAKLATVLTRTQRTQWYAVPFAAERARVVPILMELLKDPVPAIRAKAADGLGDLRGVEAFEPLMAVLNGSDREPAVAAAGALGAIGGKKIVDAILVRWKASESDVFLRLGIAMALTDTYVQHWRQMAAAQSNALDTATVMAIYETLADAIKTPCDDNLPVIRAILATPTNAPIDIVPALVHASASPGGPARETAFAAVISRKIRDERIVSLAFRSVKEGNASGTDYAVVGWIHDQRSIPTLEIAVNRGRVKDSDNAIAVLSTMGKEGIRKVMGYLGHPSDFVRKVAAQALAAKMKEDNEVRDFVYAALKSDNPKMRDGAERVMASLPAGERPPEIRMRFAIQEGGVGWRSLLPDIGTNMTEAGKSLLLDTDAALRVGGADALGEVRDRSAVPALVKTLDDNSPQVRAQAAESLGKIGDKSAVPALVKKMHDPEQGVRETATAALGQIGDRSAVGAITEAMTNADWSVRGAAAGSLGAFPTDTPAMRVLTTALDRDPHWYVRGTAAAALGRAKNAAAAPSLVAALADEHWLVRQAAHGALQAISGQTIPPDTNAWRTWLEQQKTGTEGVGR